MMSTKRELQEANEGLREKLEEVYDTVGDALGLDDDSEENPNEGDESDDEESDDDESDDDDV